MKAYLFGVTPVEEVFKEWQDQMMKFPIPTALDGR